MMDMMDWIPVSDELPSEDGRYLVFIPTMDSDSPFISVAWYHPGPEWEARWNILPKPFLKAITHWMPLPFPPGDET